MNNKRNVLIPVAGVIVLAMLLYIFGRNMFSPVALREKDHNMVLERTFAMIKPDAVSAKNAGKIIDMIEKNDFSIVKMRKENISKEKE